jgi:hypothetical protein
MEINCNEADAGQQKATDLRRVARVGLGKFRSRGIGFFSMASSLYRHPQYPIIQF